MSMADAALAMVRECDYPTPGYAFAVFDAAEQLGYPLDRSTKLAAAFIAGAKHIASRLV